MLTGCTNITGRGLQTLRNSVVLEQIDLSLVGKEDTQSQRSVSLESKISRKSVLPILERIISSNRCSLKYVQLPKKWDGSSKVRSFKDRYNEMLNRSLCCSKCHITVEPETETDESDDEALPMWYTSTLQSHVCYGCLKSFCNQCQYGSLLFRSAHLPIPGTSTIPVSECQHCEKSFCVECASVDRCSSCDLFRCNECIKKCTGCDAAFCVSCVSSTCNICEEEHCDDCMENVCPNEYCRRDCCWSCKKSCDKCGEDGCRSCISDELGYCERCTEMHEHDMQEIAADLYDYEEW